MEVLSSYLPKQLNDDEIKNICLDIKNKIGAETIKDMGKIMGRIKKKLF